MLTDLQVGIWMCSVNARNGLQVSIDPNCACMLSFQGCETIKHLSGGARASLQRAVRSRNPGNARVGQQLAIHKPVSGCQCDLSSTIWRCQACMQQACSPAVVGAGSLPPRWPDAGTVPSCTGLCLVFSPGIEGEIVTSAMIAVYND